MRAKRYRSVGEIVLEVVDGPTPAGFAATNRPEPRTRVSIGEESCDLSGREAADFSAAVRAARREIAHRQNSEKAETP